MTNRQEATEEKLFRTFDLAVTLALFESVPKSNLFICCYVQILHTFNQIKKLFKCSYFIILYFYLRFWNNLSLRIC